MNFLEDGHEHNYFDSEKGTVICRLCGVEEKHINDCTWDNCGFAMRHSPFLSGYSRTKRFKGMIEAIFWPTPANCDSLMLEYLFPLCFKNREEIINAISTAPLKDKRFGSIHMFCRLLDPEYKEPAHGCLFLMRTRIVREFSILEARFKQRYTGVPFINYTFMIRHLLKKLGFGAYLIFVKTLKCEKRKARYNEMLEDLVLQY